MNISPYELSVIAGSFTVVGALITIVGAHRLAIHLESIKRRQVAIAKLRAAFSPALSFIYIARKHGTHDRPDVDIYIKDALLTHGAAVELFRPFVVAGNSAEYQEAWEDYRQGSSYGSI